MSRVRKGIAAALALVAALSVALALGSLAHAQPPDGPFVIRLDAAPPTALAEIEPLRAYIGGRECGRQASTPAGPAIEVGGPERPELCRAPDALVTLVDRHGEQLFDQPPFGAGEEYLLVNLARGPRDATSTGASTAPAGAAAITADGPAPAVAGHGSRAGDEPPNRAMWLALGAIALGVLLFGRHLTQPIEE